jgi:hypothetical protein
MTRRQFLFSLLSIAAAFLLCNRPLEAIGFFRRAEVAITRLTGAAPRHDDRRYEMRYGVPTTATEARCG